MEYWSDGVLETHYSNTPPLRFPMCYNDPMNRKRFIILAALLIAVAILTRGSTKPMDSKRLVIGYFWTPGKFDRSMYPSIRENHSILTHLCPTRVAIADAEGNVNYGKDNYLIAFAKEKGIKLLPLVTNGGFSKEVGHKVLSDPAIRARVIDQLLDITNKWQAPGINIDIENIPKEDRPNLTAFMQELADKFHKEKLTVTIDVPAKTRDAPEAEWSGAYDYKALGECCDLVMLMAYDEHWSGGSPGPVGSANWVRKVLEYATSVIPREKVVLGVPFYSRGWGEDKTSKSYTSVSLQKLIDEVKPEIKWDDERKTHWFAYTAKDGVKHEVWFEDRDSLKYKVALAQEFGIAGISIWRLGSEDPGFWKVLAKYRKGEDVLK